MFNIDKMINIHEPKAPIEGLAEALLGTYREYLVGTEVAQEGGTPLVTIRPELLLDQIARFTYLVGSGYMVDKLASDMAALDRHNNLARFVSELVTAVGLYSAAAVYAEGGSK